MRKIISMKEVLVIVSIVVVAGLAGVAYGGIGDGDGTPSSGSSSNNGFTIYWWIYDDGNLLYIFDNQSGKDVNQIDLYGDLFLSFDFPNPSFSWTDLSTYAKLEGPFDNNTEPEVSGTFNNTGNWGGIW